MVIDLETSSVEGKIQEDLKAFLTLFRGGWGSSEHPFRGGEEVYFPPPSISGY